MKICVISDVHFYDLELGVNSPNFERHCIEEIKLIAQCEDIWSKFISEIEDKEIDIMLIPGDLTNNGELSSHTKFIKRLNQLRDRGMKIFLIPGNHDLHSRRAFSYITNEKTENVSVIQFKEMYADFGYKTADRYDKTSLSYSVALDENIRLIAIDSNNYAKRFLNLNSTSGAIAKSTLQFIENEFILAEENNEKVIIMQHHNLLHHLPDMPEYFSDFILRNYEEVRDLYLKYNVNLVLSGHHHANSIIKYEANGKTIFDMQTGSILTWSCSYRMLNIENNILEYNTFDITELENYQNFGKFAYDFAYKSVTAYILNNMKEYVEKVENGEELVNLIVQTYLAYMSGKREISDDLQNRLNYIKEKLNGVALDRKPFFDHIWGSNINHLKGKITL